MKQKPIGHVQVQVGDVSLLSQAYRELQAVCDMRRRNVSEAGLERLRQIVAEVEKLSDIASDLKPIVSSNDIWAGISR